MGTFVSDTFSGESSTVDLTAHTGEIGATWTQHASYTDCPRVYSSTSVCVGGNVTTAAAYASGIPAGAEYDISAAYKFESDSGTNPSIIGRVSTAEETFYMARYLPGATDAWQLYRTVAGTFSLLGSWSQANGNHALLLEIKDATKKVFVDGVERISSADNTITDKGRVGIRSTGASILNTFDNFSATEADGGTSYFIPQVMQHKFIPPFIGGPQ